jgi:hypothetical protein
MRLYYLESLTLLRIPHSLNQYFQSSSSIPLPLVCNKKKKKNKINYPYKIFQQENILKILKGKKIVIILFLF